MMNKALVEVYVPASGDTFDVFVPLDCKLFEVTKMLASVVGELTVGHYQASTGTALCSADTGTILDINKVVYELGIKNGSKLLLI